MTGSTLTIRHLAGNLACSSVCAWAGTRDGQMRSATAKREGRGGCGQARAGRWFAAALAIALVLVLAPAWSWAVTPQVMSQGPVTTVIGADPPNPTPGTQGVGAQFNSAWYVAPGQGQESAQGMPGVRLPPKDPFFIAYTSTKQPVQSNDWWTGVGLQWSVPSTSSGWVQGWVGGFARSTGFISEPFSFQFVDQTAKPSSLPPIAGLRLWNQNSLYVNNTGFVKPPPVSTATPTPMPTPMAKFDPTNNIVDRAEVADESDPIVTVGLQGIHPLGATQPLAPPWSNVRVESYSDWGVVLSYTDSGSKMTMTMANGSPFTWIEKTPSSASFVVWAGSNATGGSATVWMNQGPDLGVTVQTFFVPDNPTKTTNLISSLSSTVVYADKGSWTATKAKTGGTWMFVNKDATKVAVLGLPYSVPPNFPAKLTAAAKDFKQYACSKITNTQIDYPPITGSAASVTIGSKVLPLGYTRAQAMVRYQMRVTTAPFGLPGCSANPPVLQLLFPHHVKELNAAQSANILSPAAYTWNGALGPIVAYKGASFVEELRVKGMLPFFPATVVNSALKNPLNAAQTATQDIYETMKQWFYIQEPNSSISSFIRNVGTYDNVGFNTYEANWQTLIEGINIADQLSKSPQLANVLDKSTNAVGACICKNKNLVAAEIRERILSALEELVSQWGDIYSAQLLQYNPKFYTTYGFPAGFGNVQNINDHHFHYGYFLRSAGVIGRYDPKWLTAYLPMIELLRQDVANYDRTNLKYPFLRNFSAYYGHSWANGTSDSSGQDQESTSEAINFATGLIELGQLTGTKAWEDVGTLMYEQEIAATEQYWFNQGADLTKPITPPPADPNMIEYNGNWPQQFVTFAGPDGKSVWHATIAGILDQRFVKRSLFFNDVVGTYFIQQIPMSASSLYVGRNQKWLAATWQQSLLDAKQLGVLNQTLWETFFAATQARLPQTGTSLNDTGLVPALKRIAQRDLPSGGDFAPFGTDTTAKYFSYSSSQLGQVDTAVLADVPTYGVFKGTGGTTYAAYVPCGGAICGTTPVTVHFIKASDGTPVINLSVLPGTINTMGAAGAFAWSPTQVTIPKSRLYLQTTTGSAPLVGKLTNGAGTWLPAAGTFNFPASTDLSRILPSLAVVPKSTGNCSTIDLPGGPGCPTSNKAYGEWKGTFSGKLVGMIPLTSMAIYTDPAVHPGWQRQPGLATNTNVRVVYDFASKGSADRVEVVNVAPDSSNTFVIGGEKFTNYYFTCYGGFPNPGNCNTDPNPFYGIVVSPPSGPQPSVVFLDDRAPIKDLPFPPSVTCGTITVQVYGLAGPNTLPKVPLPVSVGANPVTGRGSWVQPPYDGGSCTPVPTAQAAN